MTEPRPDIQILAEWARVLTLNFGIWALVLWWLGIAANKSPGGETSGPVLGGNIRNEPMNRRRLYARRTGKAST
jgi:hypothetical protein